MDIYSMIKSHEDCPKNWEIDETDMCDARHLGELQGYNQANQEWIEFLKRCTINQEAIIEECGMYFQESSETDVGDEDVQIDLADLIATNSNIIKVSPKEER